MTIAPRLSAWRRRCMTVRLSTFNIEAVPARCERQNDVSQPVVQLFGGAFDAPGQSLRSVRPVARSANRYHPINTNRTAPSASATGDQLPLSRRM